MSAESQEIFHAALYADFVNPHELHAAAVGHLGASRSLVELTALYAGAVEAGDVAAAQAYADELQPVRAAERVTAGLLPGGN